MKKIFLYIAGVIIFIVVVGLIVRASNSGGSLFPSRANSPFATQDLKPIKLSSKEIKVVVARTESEKIKGLSGIKSMPDNEGMIFDYVNLNTSPAFWMKDMLIPLDFIWIKGGQIVEIAQGAPPPSPGTKDTDLQLYRPKETIDYVLEVNSGFVSKNNILVGTKVDLSGL